MQYCSDYCQQLDTHLSTAPVREAHSYSANVRQPQSVTIEEKKAYVEKVLKICGLAANADAVVGDLGVENRKRTTIAVELVAKPSLIFLDEPSTLRVLGQLRASSVTLLAAARRYRQCPSFYVPVVHKLIAPPDRYENQNVKNYQCLSTATAIACMTLIGGMGNISCERNFDRNYPCGACAADGDRHATAAGRV